MLKSSSALSRPGVAMKRVAVFGNAGGGKSTLARRLAELTQLPLHSLDMIQFKPGGGAVPRDQYVQAHTELLRNDAWIIDGFGSLATAWERFTAADTLVYVDLPLLLHHWWVTKRLVKGQFMNPEGWPPDSPIWTSSMSSYRVLWSCHRTLTPRYRRLVTEMAASKRVHHLRSPRQIRSFLNGVRIEQGPH